MKVFLWIFCVFSCSVLLHNSVECSEEKKGKPMEILTERKGKDAVLTCMVKDIGRRRVIWRKLSEAFPISVGTTRFTPSKKYNVDHTEEGCALTIKSVGVQDAGEYECRLSGAVYLADVVTLNVQNTKSDKTYLLPTDTELTRMVGDDCILPCEVENIDSSVVLWKNERNEVLSMRKKIYNGNRRLKVIHDTRTQWSLQIKDLTEDDFGFYTCVVNSNPLITRTIRLINKAPAKTSPLLLKDGSYKTKLEVKEGNTVTINCNFHANPPAKVTWYKRDTVDGKYVKTEVGRGNSLTLQSVRPSQMGDYVCYGRNGINPSGKGKTRIIVEAIERTTPIPTSTTPFNPTSIVSPRIFIDDERTGQKRGRDHRIKCKAIGLPRPNVHWRRHGKIVKDNYKYQTQNRETARHTLESTLVIRSMVKHDYGNYTCIAYNSIGMKSKPLSVYEL